MIRTLLEVQHAAWMKVLELLSAAGESGHAILESCVQDERVSNILLLHQLHPHDLTTRVQQTLGRLRSKGTDVELIDISESTVRLRLQTGRHSCGSTTAHLHSLIEQAIGDAAPDMAGIAWEDPAQPPQLLQLGLLSRNGRPLHSAGAASMITSGSC
jgi:Fe-S cluster biogenesis protein NfuA